MRRFVALLTAIACVVMSRRELSGVMVRCVSATSILLFGVNVNIVSLVFGSSVSYLSMFVRLLPVLHHGDQWSHIFSSVVVSMFTKISSDLAANH
jgi:hypothetical protein